MRYMKQSTIPNKHTAIICSFGHLFKRVLLASQGALEVKMVLKPKKSSLSRFEQLAAQDRQRYEKEKQVSCNIIKLIGGSC